MGTARGGGDARGADSGGSAEGKRDRDRAGPIPRGGEPETEAAAVAGGTLGPAGAGGGGPSLRRGGGGAAAARRAPRRPGGGPAVGRSPQGRRLPPEQARPSPGVAARHEASVEGLREYLGTGASAPKFCLGMPSLRTLTV